MRSVLTVVCLLAVTQTASAQGMGMYNPYNPYYPYPAFPYNYNPYVYNPYVAGGSVVPYPVVPYNAYGYSPSYYVPQAPVQRTSASPVVPPLPQRKAQSKPPAKPESKPPVSLPSHTSDSKDKEAKAREAFIRGQRKIAEIRTLVKFEKKTLQEALEMIKDGLRKASAKERAAFEQKKEFLEAQIELKEAEWKEMIDLAINEMKGNVERIFPNAQWKETPDGPSLVFPK